MFLVKLDFMFAYNKILNRFSSHFSLLNLAT